ncbi:P-loop containing nucleoside triphosphate hydrolase protein [Mycena sanguinolenta]|nr:P-loop containing nucleoside triphosphate hydrolase protein [Mycena sanguinolenta]
MDHWTIVVLGDVGVGKTSLTNQFAIETFFEICDPPMDNLQSKQIVVDNRMCLVRINDSPWLEDPAFLDQTLREGEGFILLYSITSRQSFERLESFLRTLKQVKGDDPVFMLVGNRCDRPDNEREVSKEEGAARARQLGCEFLETSAKTPQNIGEVFASLVRALRRALQKKILQEQESVPVATRPTARWKSALYHCIIV